MLTDVETRDLAASERISAALAVFDEATAGYDMWDPDLEEVRFEAMKLALAAAMPSGGWRPIETAPRGHGAQFLTWSRDLGFVVCDRYKGDIVVAWNHQPYLADLWAPLEQPALGTEAEGQDAGSGLVHEGPADLSATPDPILPGGEAGLREALIATLNAAFKGFSFPGGRWSTGYGSEMAADALLAGPLAQLQPRKDQEEAPCPMTVEEAKQLLDGIRDPKALAEYYRNMGSIDAIPRQKEAWFGHAAAIETALSTIRASEEGR